MDSEAKKEWDRAYNQRPDVKARKKDYDRARNQRPDVKARKKEWDRAYNQRPDVKAAKKRNCHLKRMHESFKGKPKKGYVYLFESITPGYLKVGCTTNWEIRSKHYSGPSAIGRMIYLGEHDHMFHTETMFKVILEEMGFKKCHGTQGDWYIKTDP